MSQGIKICFAKMYRPDVNRDLKKLKSSSHCQNIIGSSIFFFQRFLARLAFSLLKSRSSSRFRIPTNRQLDKTYPFNQWNLLTQTIALEGLAALGTNWPCSNKILSRLMNFKSSNFYLDFKILM